MNENTLIVYGDVVIQNYGKLDFNKGELRCSNFTVKNTYNSYHMYMRNANDKLVVDGNFNFYSSDFSGEYANAGTIEVRGDVNITTGFNLAQEHKVLNGLDSQKVYIDENSSFNILEVSNTSEDGICADYPISAKSTIGDLSKIHYSFGGSVGTVLSDDMELDSYCLSVGELNLNGHTLTINGDFIQAGGEVKVNNGKLIVNGNYYIQTKKTAEDGTESYDYSTGILNMTNESDIVEVSGDFVMGSTKSHNGKLSAGTLTVGGNFTQLSYNAHNNFAASGSHTTIFTSGESHTISFGSSSSGNSHFSNLTFENGSEITLKNTATVIGELKGTNCVVSGYVGLVGSAKVIGKYSGSLSIGETYNLNSDISAVGDLYVSSYLSLNGYKFSFDGGITISGNVYLNGGELNCKKNIALNRYLNIGGGKLICEGNVNIPYYYGHMNMQNANDEVHISGDFTFDGGDYSSYFTNGKLYIGGNCTIYRSAFNAQSKHETIFNGDKKQIINVTVSNAGFGKVTLNNTSEDGIEITNSFNYTELVNESGCKVTFANGGSAGETLSADKIVDGDYTLAMGELNLNGHTLTINGDFIQAGGEVKVNSGKLIVNGNYYIQTKKTAEDGTESYDYSTGILNMTNESDIVEVSGDFVMGSTKSHNGKLSAGTLIVGGNFTQLSYNARNNFVASGSHTIEFNGKIKQNISFASPDNSRFFNLKVNNTNGVSLNSSVYAYGNVNDVNNSVCGSGYLYITKLSQLENSSFGGSVYLNNDNRSDIYLALDLSVGNLTCNYLHLNGYKLNVNNLSINSNLYVEGGAVECKNNLTLGNNGYLTMTDEKDYVLVGKNFVSNLRYSTNGYLTSGTLEIKGDFIQNQNAAFVCTGTHTTILSGKSASNGRIYVQTVKMYNNGSKFNTLIITKPSSFYVAKNQNNTTVSLEDFCNELIEDYDDIEPPTKVTGLTASEVLATSIHIVWEQSTDNVRVTGYEVYRNGEKLVTTGRTEFIDESLEPNIAYTYQVYAFDESRNYSAASDKINPKTLADTDSPEVPQNVKIKSVTGSSLTLSWNASKDNVGTEGYVVYCNNEEISRTEECEFKHSGLTENEEYSYMIKAYDKAGNLSDFSENITGSVVMPKITSVTPGDLSSLGGKSQTITVVFDKISSDGGNKVRFEFSESGKDEYTPISNELIGAQNYSANKLCAKCTWNTEGLDGNYDVRVTLFDADDNSDCAEVMYTVTSSGPKAPQNLKAEADNGTVVLTWKKSVSADCKKYIIYRQDSEEGEFEPIA
ncbi:MAG: fibronectin type III domain-containing protein [Ruminococcus sp.]|nr:fibronectin type III domain-containing protein [Ruminococcus sp.]